MKKSTVLIALFFPGILVIGLVGLLSFSGDQRLAPSKEIACPILVDPKINELVETEFPKSIWQVYSSPGTGGVLQVYGGLSDLEFPELQAEGWAPPCQLSVRNAPDDMEGIDWRMGFSQFLPPTKVENYVKLKVKYRTLEGNAFFPSASAYLHDGQSVASIPLVLWKEKWQESESVIKTGAASNAIEAWVRLAINEGKIRPDDVDLLITAKLELADKPTPIEVFAKKVSGLKRQSSCGILWESEPSTMMTQELTAHDWVLYSHPLSNGLLPDINLVDASPDPNRTGAICGIKIEDFPLDTASGGGDWRIGRVLTIPPELSGRKLNMRLYARADRDMAFEAGSFYGHNGIDGTGVSISNLTEQWQDFNFTIDVPAGQTTVEIWFRLHLDKSKIIPSQGQIYFQPIASLVP